MSDLSDWEYMALVLSKIYDVRIDWDKEFFECPACDARIYKKQYNSKELYNYCPICGYKWWNRK